MKAMFAVLVLGIFFFGCSTDKDDVLSTTGKITTTATIIWQGEYAVDGCGFFVRINQKEYKPKNESMIGDEFKTPEPQEAEVTLRFLSEKVEYYCGFAGKQVADGVEIISIQKK